MKKKQKLAIITTWYPPVNGEFVENYAKDFSDIYDVHVFVAYPSCKTKTISQKENDLTVHRIYFPHIPRRTTLTIDLWIKTFVKKILAVTQDIDLIHAHNFHGGYVARALSKKLKKDFWVTLHSSAVLNNKLNSAQSKALKSTLTNAKNVICVGHQLKKNVEEKYKVDTLLIPNYVTTQNFTIQPKKTPFKFIMIGSLGVYKGIEEVLEAFSHLPKEQVEFHIIGYIGKDANIPKHILNQKNIIHHGFLPHKNIPEILAQCHSLISFSVFETFGITTIEAMSCGLPILYCKSGGPEYFIPDYAGILVDRNTNALEEGMRQMIENYSQFDADQIRSYVVKNYDKEVIKQKMINLY